LEVVVTPGTDSDITIFIIVEVTTGNVVSTKSTSIWPSFKNHISIEIHRRTAPIQVHTALTISISCSYYHVSIVIVVNIKETDRGTKIVSTTHRRSEYFVAIFIHTCIRATIIEVGPALAIVPCPTSENDVAIPIAVDVRTHIHLTAESVIGMFTIKYLVRKGVHWFSAVVEVGPACTCTIEVGIDDHVHTPIIVDICCVNHSTECALCTLLSLKDQVRLLTDIWPTKEDIYPTLATLESTGTYDNVIKTVTIHIACTYSHAKQIPDVFTGKGYVSVPFHLLAAAIEINTTSIVVITGCRNQKIFKTILIDITASDINTELLRTR